MEKKHSWVELAICCAVGGVLSGFATNCVINYKYGRDIKEVQAGYVAPSEINRIYAEDLDRDGNDETIIKIKDKKYLLKYDSSGNPAIVPYKVKVEEDREQRAKEGALTGKVGG